MARSLVLLGVLAACGDQLVVVDAPPPVDASGDLVTVEVHSSLANDNTRVFFQRQDSTLVLATTTDADGRVQASIPEHTMVTVDMVDAGGQHWLMSQLEVNPGDDIVFDDGTSIPSASIIVTTPSIEGGVNYQVRAPCPASSGGGDIAFADADTTTVTLSVTLHGCETTGDLIVEATASDFATKSFLYRKGVLLADGASVQLTGEYQPQVPITLRALHVPPKARSITLRQGLLDGAHELRLTDSEPFAMSPPFDGFSDTVELTTLDDTWPDAAAMTQVTADAFGASMSTVYAWGPRDDTTTTIDFGDDSLHEYLTRPTYTQESNLVGWLEADQGRLGDAVLIELNGSTATASMYWRLFAPRREQTWVNVPVLPDPALTAVSVAVTSATNIAIDGGYERLRKLPRLVGAWSPSPRFLNGQFIDFEWPIDAPTGRVVLQRLGNGGF